MKKKKKKERRRGGGKELNCNSIDNKDCFDITNYGNDAFLKNK